MTTRSLILGGGCFWCMQPAFDTLPGVTGVTSGYAGGPGANPTYEQVCRGDSGHIEVVKVDYDPAVIGRDALLDHFWRNIDPFDAHGQFCDEGPQYLSVIFHADEEERQAALASAERARAALGSDAPFATLILPAAPFWPAEDYHQNYCRTHPVRYTAYRVGCRRDQRLSRIWGAAAGGAH